MIHSILGEKITYLVTEFHNNPQPFIAAYKARSSFTHMLFDNTQYEQTHEQFMECSPNDRGGIFILTGTFCNTLENERWLWPSISDDMIMYAPQSTCSTKLRYQEAFGSEAEKADFDYLNKDYTEEELFQYSTVLTDKALETLELFLYLKMHCTIPFKINLLAFDIDNAIEVYKCLKNT